MSKKIVIAGAAVAAVAAVVVLPKALRPKAVMKEAPLPMVEVQMPQDGTIELYRDLVGKVEPSEVVYIYPKAAGEVTEIFVKAGDMVEAGQAICTIDTKQVEAARLSMEAAKTALGNANSTLVRQRALYEAGDLAPATYEGVQTQARAAQIQYEQAKLNYDYQMEFSNITADISGRLESFNVDVHDNVSSQVLLGVIAGEGSKSVSFSVPEKIAKNLKVGDSVHIEKNGMEYEGQITQVSSMIDNATGLFSVKSSVDDADALPTGSSVKLYVTAERQENVMTLPVDSIYYSGGDAYVYTYDNGTVHRVPVEVGVFDSELAQILSGIDASAQVITTWSSELYEGSQVQIAGVGAAGIETAEGEGIGAEAAEGGNEAAETGAAEADGAGTGSGEQQAAKKAE